MPACHAVEKCYLHMLSSVFMKKLKSLKRAMNASHSHCVISAESSVATYSSFIITTTGQRLHFDMCHIFVPTSVKRKVPKLTYF